MIPRRLREGLTVDGHQRIARRTAAVRSRGRSRNGGCVGGALNKRVVGVGRGLDALGVQLRRHVPCEGSITALLA